LRDRERVPLAEPHVIEQMWQSFADLGPLEHHVLDLDARGPEEAADLLSRQLADGLLAV
jgi:hypothetical protein